MSKAIAPSRARGLRKLSLAIATALAWPLALSAQPGGAPPERPATKGDANKKGGSAPAPAPAADADDDGKPDEPEAPPPPKGSKEVSEVFRDPLTDEVLKNTKNFKALSGPPPPPADAIRKMAQNLVATDGAQLEQFVKAHTSEMASGTVIRKLAAKTTKENQEGVESVEKAFGELLDPILQAQKANNNAFLTAYSKLLVQHVTPLLSNHLYARVEGMILLGKAGDPAVVRTLVDQIKDPKQVVMVKLQAAHGITTVLQGGKRRLAAPSEEIDAAKALDKFLNDEPNAIWPARFRAVEAPGALRQPSINAAVNDLKMAATIAKILEDPQIRPEVRATAAWALGMMRVESGGKKVDFREVAANVGHLAVELGEKILKVRSGKGNLQAADLTALLAYPVYNSLKGEPGVIKSGLLASGALGQANRPFVAELEQLVKAEAAAAVELEQAPLALLARPRKQMSDSIEALKKFLDANAKPPGGNGVASGVGGPQPK